MTHETDRSWLADLKSSGEPRDIPANHTISHPSLPPQARGALGVFANVWQTIVRL